MGHHGNLKEEYRALVRRLEAGQVSVPEPEDQKAWKGWKDILEIMYSPDEAELASRLPVKPSGLSEISKRVGISAEELAPRLDTMCEKGLVMDLENPRDGTIKYALSPPVVGFFEFSLMRIDEKLPQKEIAEALDAYAHGDPAFAMAAFDGATVIGRSLVHEDGVHDADLPDVLDWESATSLIEEAHTLTVSHCYCRHKAQHLGTACDQPTEVCLSINAGAKWILRRDFGRSIERSEALENLHASRESGLVQIADNVQNRPSYICNCCGCCCGQLGAINQYDLHAVNPSGFIPEVDYELCKGCSRCSRACPITALDMESHRVQSQLKNVLLPAVDYERCIGCGVCTQSCRAGALKMVRRPIQPYIPSNTMERTIRMSLERGKLPHLLFDEGQSRGHKFMNRAFSALCRLPAADKILASEQVRSRFLKAALLLVPSPTGE